MTYFFDIDEMSDFQNRMINSINRGKENMDRYKKEETYSRVWLNEKHGRAYTIVNVEADLEVERKWGNPSVDAYLDVADCSKTTQLEFSIDDLKDQEEVDKVKRKMARFREEFKKLEDAVLQAIEKAKDIPKFVRKNK